MDRPHLDAHLDRTQAAILGTLVGGLTILRLVDVFHYRIDTDEPQHLHVVWAWTHGLLQYRDVFDNHAPLFHLLFAPALALVGERASVVAAMRLTVLPLYGLAVGCTYAIGVALFSRRLAAWAAVLTAFYAGFFFTSLEFRADDLWAALWLLGVAVLVHGRATPWRALAGGVALGAALGTSLKTVLLLASIAPAALVATKLVPSQDGSSSWRAVALRCAALVAGVAVVPTVLVAYFARRGALPAMYAGAVAHNVLPGLGMWKSAGTRALVLPAAAPLLWLAARRVARSDAPAALARRRILVLLTAGIALTLLFGVWPLVTRQDFLALDPLVIVLATGFALEPAPAAAGTTPLRRHAVAIPLVLLALEGGALVWWAPPWQDRTRQHAGMVAAVLRLTAPGDYVMDVKGETIFRRRPFFYAIEHITKTRLARGFIADDVAERLVATRTAVAVLDHANFPPAGRAFLNANYIPVGPIRVLGRLLPAAPAGVRFDVAIPSRYAIITEHGRADGVLDGSPYDGPRFLASGTHEFARTAATKRLALVWEPALAHGFSPFPAEETHAASG